MAFVGRWRSIRVVGGLEGYALLSARSWRARMRVWVDHFWKIAILITNAWYHSFIVYYCNSILVSLLKILVDRTSVVIISIMLLLSII